MSLYILIGFIMILIMISKTTNNNQMRMCYIKLCMLPLNANVYLYCFFIFLLLFVCLFMFFVCVGVRGWRSHEYNKDDVLLELFVDMFGKVITVKEPMHNIGFNNNIQDNK